MHHAAQLPILHLATGLNRLPDAVKANKAANLFFFSPDTMRFFDSRIESGLIGGALFITSERPPKGARSGDWEKRRFTIRAALADGNVATIGDFGEYPTQSKAHKAAERLAADLRADGQAIRDGYTLTYAPPR